MELSRIFRSAIYYFIEGTAELLSTLGIVSEFIAGVSFTLVPILETKLIGSYGLMGVAALQSNTTLVLSNEYYQEMNAQNI